jgi:hypothetical protein
VNFEEATFFASGGPESNTSDCSKCAVVPCPEQIKTDQNRSTRPPCNSERIRKATCFPKLRVDARSTQRFCRHTVYRGSTVDKTSLASQCAMAVMAFAAPSLLRKRRYCAPVTGLTTKQLTSLRLHAQRPPPAAPFKRNRFRKSTSAAAITILLRNPTGNAGYCQWCLPLYRECGFYRMQSQESRKRRKTKAQAGSSAGVC